MITTYLRLPLCCFAALTAATISQPANALDASTWQPDTHSAVRLIAGGLRPSDTLMRAGIEIKLDPGWKTYWRYPGDSGVPPRFDFAQSVNVKSVKLLWPVPHRFVDESGSSIGYKDDVIFPLQVVPSDPAKPVTLRLKLDYAICEKLCVPAEGNAELLLSAESSLPPCWTRRRDGFQTRATRRPSGRCHPRPSPRKPSRARTRHRRCRSFACRFGAPVCRRANTGLGAAPDRTGELGACLLASFCF